MENLWKINNNLFTFTDSTALLHRLLTGYAQVIHRFSTGCSQRIFIMSIDFDNTWNALLQPGRASQYFSIPKLIPMQPENIHYDPINAWWLMEFARLIYRQEADELAEEFDGLTRNSVLAKVGFKESRFFNGGRTQCAIIEAVTQPPVTILVFRGTDHIQDWIANLTSFPVAWEQSGTVHYGFKEEFTEVWSDIAQYLTTVTTPIIYTGHSLGGALALLAASVKPPHMVYTFGAPRVGDQQFVNSLKDIPIYRIVNNRDAVPTLPPVTALLEFCHVGELHYIAHDGTMLNNPSDNTIDTDRQRSDPTLTKTANARQWFDPYEFLADHAPINYSAYLSRQLLKAI